MVETWILERDIPQTRNLVPILNRTTIIAAQAGSGGGSDKAADAGGNGSAGAGNMRSGTEGKGTPAPVGGETRYALTWRLAEPNVRKGPFWPEFGARARMGLPLVRPDEFPIVEPHELEAPDIDVEGSEALLRWAPVRLEAGEGAVAYADVWLGPPDMYHTAEGLSFGDVRVDTEYSVAVEPAGGTEEGAPVKMTCRMTLRNTHPTEAVEDLEFAFFFPRALLNGETGGEIPLIGAFACRAEGFPEAEPLDLLITDGLGRGAWGPRFSERLERLEAGDSRDYSVEVTGTIIGASEGKGVLIAPLVSFVGRIRARYWPSSEVEVSSPGNIHYSDYTHFNLVVADSRLFRLRPGAAEAEASSGEVRAHLGTGLK